MGGISRPLEVLHELNVQWHQALLHADVLIRPSAGAQAVERLLHRLVSPVAIPEIG